MKRRGQIIPLAVALVWIAASGLLSAQIPAATLKQADDALQAGEADKALALLRPLPTRGQGAADAQNLICRAWFSMLQWDQAINACQLSVQLDPNSSNGHMWLGRALGQKADHVSFLSAYSLGKRVRGEFERAVQLDQRNAAALSDLGQFYKEAPQVVGGGLDKAERIAAQLDRVDPVLGFELHGRIASARKDYGTAERNFRQAIAVSPHPAEPWTVLASFYRGRQRWGDMETAIHNCANAAAHDKHSGVGLYDGAGILIETKRDPVLAAKMLQNYLASPWKSEEAPAFIAHIRLARLDQKLGDAAAAQREFASAAAMAREFSPAQDPDH